MSPHQIIAVAGRLLCVWMAVRLPALAWQFFYVASLSSPDGKARHLIAGFVLLVNVIVIILLWFFPKTIARKLLVSSSPEPTPPSPSSADTWLRMGCALIGLWVLVNSVPSLVLDAFVLFSMNFDEAQLLQERSMLYSLAEIVIGIWLILGAKGFRKLFWWASTAGISKTPE